MKKSRLLIAVLAATMFVLAAFGFVACDKDAGDIGGVTPQQPVTPTTSYTVTFNYNGGSGAPASAKTTNGKLASLPTPTTAPTGKKFDAWYTAATGGNKVTTATTFNKDTTIFAQYTDNGGTPTPSGEYTITLDATTNGGSCATASVTTTNKVIPTLPAATKGTDTFNGWFTSPTGGTKVNSGDTADGTVTTIYAQFTAQGEQPPLPVTKTDGVYAGDTNLNATVAVNSGNADELMITGLVLSSDADIAIYYNGTAQTVTPIAEEGTGGDIVSVAADGMSVRLTAGSYTLYYSFQGEKAGKLWAIKDVVGPSTDKNAGFTYDTDFANGLNSGTPHLVGKFYSRGMNSYAWGDGYKMEGSNGNWTLKNIYLYAGDCLKVRANGTDGDGTNGDTSAQIEIYDRSMRVLAGGEGYYTISFNGTSVTVTFHGANPAA